MLKENKMMPKQNISKKDLKHVNGGTWNDKLGLWIGGNGCPDCPYHNQAMGIELGFDGKKYYVCYACGLTLDENYNRVDVDLDYGKYSSSSGLAAGSSDFDLNH